MEEIDQPQPTNPPNQDTTDPDAQTGVPQQKEFRLDDGLIEGLKEEANFLAIKYNQLNNPEFEDKNSVAKSEEQNSEQKEVEKIDQMAEEKKISVGGKQLEKPVQNSGDILKARFSSRKGGIYVPPHKLRAMREQILKEANNDPEILQRFKWDLLKKSINSIVNKVSPHPYRSCFNSPRLMQTTCRTLLLSF